MNTFYLYGLLILAFIGRHNAQRGSVTVRTPQGVLLGREQIIGGKYIYSFRNIKYATSPTRENRFRPVAPYLDTWGGIKSAQEEGPPCPQPFSTEGLPYSEDCLHLSVWTSVLPDGRTERLPVLLYLTGNLFTTDNNEEISPQDLVSRVNIIVVTISYRLNVLGFLSLENPALPGNLGLLDQYYGLYWVYNNIQYFGGDPDQITLAGSGSGAASALYHALSSRAAPLIKSVMVVSGSPLASWALSTQPKENGLRFIERLDCLKSTSYEVLDCLQKHPIQNIINALESHLSSGNTSHLFSPVDDSFLPSVDQYLGGDPEFLIRNSNYRIPVLIGLNTGEGKDIVDFLRYNLDRYNVRDLQYIVENTLVPSAINQFHALVNNQIVQEMLLTKYFHNRNYQNLQDKSDILEDLSGFYTQAFFTSPLQKTVELLSSNNFPVYFFINSYSIESTNTNSSSNARSFLALFFGTTQYERFTGSIMRRELRDISDRFQATLVPFLRFGRPSANIQWPRFEEKDPRYLDLLTGQVLRNFKKDDTSFWNELLPRLNALTSDTASEKPCTAQPNSSQVDVYSTLTWLLLAVVLLLLVLLALLWVHGRRRTRNSSVFTLGSGIGGSCLERQGPRPGSGPRAGRWRETLTSNKL